MRVYNNKFILSNPIVFEIRMYTIRVRINDNNKMTDVKSTIQDYVTDEGGIVGTTGGSADFPLCTRTDNATGVCRRLQ